MQFVSTANTAITDGVSEVVAAVTKAKSTLQDELTAGLSEANTAISSVSDQVKAIVDAVAGLTDTLDPQQLVAPLQGTMQTLQADAKSVGIDLLAMGERVVALSKSLGGITDDVKGMINFGAGLPQRVMDLKPDASEVAPHLQTLLDESGAVRTSLLQLSEKSQGFAGRLAPLQRRVQLLRRNAPGDVLSQHAAITAEIRDLVDAFNSTLDQVDETWVSAGLTVEKEVAAADAIMKEISDAFLLKVDALADDIGHTTDPIVSRADETIAGIEAEIEALRAMGETLKDRLHGIMEGVLHPIRQVEAAIDTVVAQIDAIKDTVDTVLDALEAQLKRLDSIVAGLKRCIDEVVAAVDKAIRGMQQAICEVHLELDGIKNQLLHLPDAFEPVDLQITLSKEAIAGLQSEVRAFMASADRALVQASREIDQAGTQCDAAIKECTKHVPRSMPMVAARALFMGLKASLPAIKSTISSARTGVKSAGTTTLVLLDEAITHIEDLRPVLRQAIEAIKLQIGLVIEVLDKLGVALQTASDAMSVVGEKMHTTADLVKAQPDPIIQKIRAMRDDFVAKAQPHEKIDAVRDQVLEIKSTALNQVRSKIDVVHDKMLVAINAGQDKMREPVKVVKTQLDMVKRQIALMQDNMYEPVRQLRDLMETLQRRLHEQLLRAKGIADRALDQSRQATAQARSLSGRVNDEVVDVMRVFGPFVIRVQQKADQVEGFIAQGQDLVVAARTQAQEAAQLVEDLKANSQEKLNRVFEKANGLVQALDNVGKEMSRAGAEFKTQSEHASESVSELESATKSIQDAADHAQAGAAMASEDVEAAGTESLDALKGSSAGLDSMLDDSLAAVGPPGDEARVQQELLESSLAAVVAPVVVVKNETDRAKDQVDARAESALDEVTKLKDQGQATLAQSKAQVAAAQAQVAVAKAQAGNAEATMDAAVTAAGGAPAAVSTSASPAVSGAAGNGAGVASGGAAPNAAASSSASGQSATGAEATKPSDAGAVETSSAGATAATTNNGKSAELQAGESATSGDAPNTAPAPAPARDAHSAVAPADLPANPAADAGKAVASAGTSTADTGSLEKESVISPVAASTPASAIGDLVSVGATDAPVIAEPSFPQPPVAATQLDPLTTSANELSGVLLSAQVEMPQEFTLSENLAPAIEILPIPEIATAVTLPPEVVNVVGTSKVATVELGSDPVKTATSAGNRTIDAASLNSEGAHSPSAVEVPASAAEALAVPSLIGLLPTDASVSSAGMDSLNTATSGLSGESTPAQFETPQGFKLPEGLALPEGIALPADFSLPPGLEVPQFENSEAASSWWQAQIAAFPAT